MELIYGTKNNAKIASMQKCLQGLKMEIGVEIIGLQHLHFNFPEIEEDGNNPLDNARMKALAYYQLIKRPVFSLDSGLYFDGLPDHLQPGVNVRRVNGKRLSDDEMIAYYSSLAKDNGGTLVGRYVNGLCLVMDKHLVFEHMGEDIATKKFLLTTTPHAKRVDGFPLDSLSVDIRSNAYYYDLHEDNFDKEDAWSTDKGFCDFFRSAMRNGKSM